MPRYWIDLFTPETWEEFRSAGSKISGFRENRFAVATKVKPGDLFVCYIARIGRFAGIIKVESTVRKDPVMAKGIWKGDFFPSILDVKPIVEMDIVHSVPKAEIIPKLPNATKWGGYVRGSPTRIPEEDGKIIEKLLRDFEKEGTKFPIEGILKPAAKVRSRPEYGTPIDFRGLRHAPINEQGVVYLFALVSRDLGFKVEGVGTRFPDCEALRLSNKAKNRWQRVRIEFEYTSTDFRKHKHRIDECDIIVCWKHDWQGCPLEVIELSRVIKKLGARFENNNK